MAWRKENVGKFAEKASKLASGPIKAGLGVGMAMDRAIMGATRGRLESISEGMRRAWEPHYGARRVLGTSLGLGIVTGAAMSSFRFNREVAYEAMARAEEGTAYGSGDFSSAGSSRLPHANGRMTLGMHKARHG